MDGCYRIVVATSTLLTAHYLWGSPVVASFGQFHIISHVLLYGRVFFTQGVKQIIFLMRLTSWSSFFWAVSQNITNLSLMVFFFTQDVQSNLLHKVFNEISHISLPRCFLHKNIFFFTKYHCLDLSCDCIFVFHCNDISISIITELFKECFAKHSWA